MHISEFIHFSFNRPLLTFWIFKFLDLRDFKVFSNYIEILRDWAMMINFCFHLFETRNNAIIFHFIYGIVTDRKARSRPTRTAFIVG